MFIVGVALTQIVSDYRNRLPDIGNTVTGMNIKLTFAPLLLLQMVYLCECTGSNLLYYTRRASFAEQFCCVHFLLKA